MSDSQRKYPHRLACVILDEMRDLYKTYNFSPMLSLIEEIQSVVNRMESALEYQDDIEFLHKKRDSLNKEISDLKKEIKGLIEGKKSMEGIHERKTRKGSK